MAILDDVKTACRVSSSVEVYDDELTDLIDAGIADLGISDIDSDMLTLTDMDPLIKRALLTYCKMNFGKLEDSVYDRYKKSYDEQKSQMLMSSNYNFRGDD